ncbi:MAG TPA: hypothetical protein PKL84_01470, partial [Candidatus Hydrogenedentes bacterium]|nr:hypothetical protein [Candidatus Hydrogenedentota bacterium]
MKRGRHRLLCLALVLSAAMGGASSVGADTPIADAADAASSGSTVVGFEEIWVGPGTATPAPRATLD